jgi:hypothetical protein
MSVDRYACCDERRRTLINAGPAGLSGIDYVEVDAGATTADPTTIDIVLVKPLAMPAAQLTVDNISLTGGVRFPAPKISAVDAKPLAGQNVERYTVTIPGNQPTDFSTYHLALVKAPGKDDPPDFIDDRLAAVDLSFKGACPGDFDCAPDCSDVEAPEVDPTFDYRARDYPGFRRLMLDRFAQLVPGFREDDPADFTTLLVELAAYRADQQSYRLDWVGTEAFLGTARSPTSIARHARLVDYDVNEGASARVFARLDSGEDNLKIPVSTPLLVRIAGVGPVVPSFEYPRLYSAGATVFETVKETTLWQWRNKIDFYTWDDDECRLPKGSTSATLVDAGNGVGRLAPGDFLLLAETASPDNGQPEDARMDHRHIVRISGVQDVKDKLHPGATLVTVEWDETDQLPFDLVIQTRAGTSNAAAKSNICAQACANVVLADNGASLPPLVGGIPQSDMDAMRPTLSPPAPVADETWRPKLDRGDLARIEPPDLKMAASLLMSVDPAQCLPQLALDDDFDSWTARRDLLASGPYDRDVVVETAIDGSVALRFGDNVEGSAPVTGAQLAVHGRFGSGLSGNIGAGALAHIVLAPPNDNKVVTVSNPLAARGGSDPESIPSIRIAAPQAFRRQERAVSAEDYAQVAKGFDGVADAVAVPRWTGAWQTMLVYVDRKGGIPMDDAFRHSLLDYIERYRLMGFDVALRDAMAAPLDIELLVCAKPEELRAIVGARVREALRPSGGASGATGFFHPDHFTFGAPLYLSKLVDAVMKVDGVQSVTVLKFQRLRGLPANELDEGVIRPHDFEVLQLEDDPSFPERGRLVLDLGGGR